MTVEVYPKSDVIVQMRPAIERNNLEKYLDYLKEKETDYNIEQEEVGFIQSGIETLVQKIYDLVTKKSKNVDCKNNANILKVGSFYEGTKNKFPNEFDFIFVLAELGIEEDTTIEDKLGSLKMQERKDFDTMIKDVLHSDLKYSENASWTIYFKEFVKVQGPASKLMFIYQKDKFKDTCLHLDIVPAYKITDAKLGVSVKRICSLEPFRKEIVDTGSYLLVGIDTELVKSFTETEVHFMKHTLSLKHVTVYKLLKFLIGGHGHAEKVREKIHREGFSSYMIKTAMIIHHYECRNTDSEEKAPCVMTVLENLLRYKRENVYPTLTFISYSNEHGKSEKLLERRIKHLRRMQKSTNKLNLIYRKLELKPVGKQRLVMYKRETFCKRYRFVILGALILLFVFLVKSIESIMRSVK